MDKKYYLYERTFSEFTYDRSVANRFAILFGQVHEYVTRS